MSEDDFIIDDRRKKLFLVAERKIEMPSLNLADFGLILGTGAELEKWHGVLQIVDLHPAAKQIAHFLVSGIVDSIGKKLGQAVQHLERHRRCRQVRDFRVPGQRGEPVARHVEVHDFHLKIQGMVRLFDYQLVKPDSHCPPDGGVLALILERFVDGAAKLDERPEAAERHIFVADVSRGELHDGRILVPDAEACNSLAPVDVERPHRDALRSG
ncbi:hypothetical protein D3C71_1374720 [compost metagenome]